MTLSEQMSLRLTESQRDYLRREVQRLRDDPLTAAFRWSEADVLRVLVEQARVKDETLTELTVTALLSGADR